MTDSNLADPDKIELQRLRLEQARYKTDILKWIIIALGAIISFAVIDYGNLQLARFQATTENQRELLNAYLKATESPQPEIWKRKLNLIVNSTDDQGTIAWAKKELAYIKSFAELDTLYRETLKVASQLVERRRLNAPERVNARIRYNQLYFAELPYAGESTKVSKAMSRFRDQLLIAENTAQNPELESEWDKLKVLLVDLSTAIRVSTPAQDGS